MKTSAGGAASVVHGGTLATGGSGSAGILAQSVGGGGGVSALSMRNAIVAAIAQTATHSIKEGGDNPSDGYSGFSASQLSAGSVNAANNLGRIVTQGVYAPGILAQSVGGGGGVAAVSSTVILSGVDIRLGAPVAGIRRDPKDGVIVRLAIRVVISLITPVTPVTPRLCLGHVVSTASDSFGRR